MTDEPRPPREITRRTVRVKPHSYRPTKAEMGAPIDLRKADGTRPTPEELANAMLAPVKIFEDPEA